MAEYAVSGELEEACTCLSEIDSALRWAAVSEAVSDTMERKQMHRDALGEKPRFTIFSTLLITSALLDKETNHRIVALCSFLSSRSLGFFV